MKEFVKITKEDIEQSLAYTNRQYLAGYLQREQLLPFYQTKALEIGITSYNQYAYEAPHRHTRTMEFQYMLSGMTQYINVETGEEFTFRKGDFYAIESDIIYAQKSKAGTKILFIKVPSDNDKEIIAETDSIVSWGKSGIKSKRIDYFHAPNAPKANSIHPAASVAIIEDNKILLLHRVDNGKWTMPGGTMEFGESLTRCAVREVEEETGLKIEINGIIGTYSDPNILIEYSDGEIRQEFTTVYLGFIKSGEIKIDHESSAYQWVSLIDIDTISMADSQRRRLHDVITYIKTGKQHI